MNDREEALEPCLSCGHDKRQHIYGDGACRPGFACPSHCEAFEPMPAPAAAQPDPCGAYTYVGAGGGQYVGCRNGCDRLDTAVPCADALGAFKLVEHLHFDCPIEEKS